MLKNVRVAVIGLGFVGGQAHVPALKKIHGAELGAVVDIIEDWGKKVAAKYDVKYYKDYMEVVRNPDFEAVVVAVPTPFHYNIVSDAIANGKHVLCEMPLAPTVAETEKLGKAATEAGVVLLPDLNFRFTPNYVKAKELIDNAALGKPLAMTFSEFIPTKDLAAQWPRGSWAWNIERSGGYPDFTLSVWSIDLARWLFESEIVDSKWASNYSNIEGLENFTGYNTVGIIQFSNGGVGALHYCSTIARGEGSNRLEVFGDNTRVLKATWNNQLALIGEGSKEEWSFAEKGPKVWGHYQIDNHFIECILYDRKPAVTVEDAIKAQSVSAKMVKKR